MNKIKSSKTQATKLTSGKKKYLKLTLDQMLEACKNDEIYTIVTGKSSKEGVKQAHYFSFMKNVKDVPHIVTLSINLNISEKQSLYVSSTPPDVNDPKIGSRKLLVSYDNRTNEPKTVPIGFGFNETSQDIKEKLIAVNEHLVELAEKQSKELYPNFETAITRNFLSEYTPKDSDDICHSFNVTYSSFTNGGNNKPVSHIKKSVDKFTPLKEIEENGEPVKADRLFNHVKAGMKAKVVIEGLLSAKCFADYSKGPKDKKKIIYNEYSLEFTLTNTVLAKSNKSYKPETEQEKILAGEIVVDINSEDEEETEFDE